MNGQEDFVGLKGKPQEGKETDDNTSRGDVHEVSSTNEVKEEMA